MTFAVRKIGLIDEEIIIPPVTREPATGDYWNVNSPYYEWAAIDWSGTSGGPGTIVEVYIGWNTISILNGQNMSGSVTYYDYGGYRYHRGTMRSNDGMWISYGIYRVKL